MNWVAAFAMVVLSTAIGFGLFVWVAVPVDHGMFEVADSHVANLLVGFAATVAGVVLGSTYRHLAQLRQQGVQTMKSFRAQAVGIARSVDLWMGLVASPLVYGLLIQSLADVGRAGLVIVGLENGFCCLLIADAFMRRSSSQNSITGHSNLGEPPAGKK